MFRTPEKNINEFFRSTFSQLQLPKDHSHIMYFGRLGHKQWEVVYIGPADKGKLPPGIKPSQWNAVCWGLKRKQDRLVIQLFSNQWMLYDKFGLYHYTVTKGWDPAQARGRASQGPTSAALDCALLAEEQAFVQEEADGLKWYEERAEKREARVHDIKASEGESSFKFGESLRITWLSEQKADKELANILNSKPMKDGFRVASDGILEREV